MKNEYIKKFVQHVRKQQEIQMQNYISSYVKTKIMHHPLSFDCSMSSSMPIVLYSEDTHLSKTIPLLYNSVDSKTIIPFTDDTNLINLLTKFNADHFVKKKEIMYLNSTINLITDKLKELTK